MKIAVIGAGAIGGYVGAKLALAGEDVSFIVRGAHVAAINGHGMTLIAADGSEQVARNVKAYSDYAEAGARDLVIIALKAHQLDNVAPEVRKLLGPDTAIVTMQNGIPFWYFHKHGGELAGSRLKTVDASGTLGDHIPADRILGCVVYPAAELLRPGVVKHIEGERFPLGELDGASSERVTRIAASFVRAGLKAPVLDNIRAEIWLKLWGNLTFNPISSLSHATLEGICQFPLSRELAADMMREAQAVATQLGIGFRVSLEQRIAGAEKVGKHKTSMLQDVEAGREPEVDALLGSVIELARLTGTPTPHLDTAYALVKLLAHSMAEVGGGVRLQALR